MAKVNLVQLRREIDAQEARVIMPRMKDVLNKKFEDEKKKLLNNFDDNKVNKELSAGPSAAGDIVNTAKGGNLYSLLGFVDGVEPVKELRDALENGITKGTVIKEQKARSKLNYSLEVRIPTLAELKRKTQLLKWTTRSFIDLIENGIDNFRRYLFDDSGRLAKYSRSGTAIQIKNEIKQGRSAKIRGMSYITKMIEKFKKDLRKFNN